MTDHIGEHDRMTEHDRTNTGQTEVVNTTPQTNNLTRASQASPEFREREPTKRGRKDISWILITRYV